MRLTTTGSNPSAKPTERLTADAADPSGRVARAHKTLWPPSGGGQIESRSTKRNDTRRNERYVRLDYAAAAAVAADIEYSIQRVDRQPNLLRRRAKEAPYMPIISIRRPSGGRGGFRASSQASARGQQQPIAQIACPLPLRRRRRPRGCRSGSWCSSSVVRRASAQEIHFTRLTQWSVGQPESRPKWMA